jgi:NAD+ kinase
MIYGITGNTQKEQLWKPVAELLRWLQQQGLQAKLHPAVAEGLTQRKLLNEAQVVAYTARDLATEVDIILSFGGDGTLLQSAHLAGRHGTPILGINIGRMGFLADVEVEHVREAISALERGDYTVEARMALEAELEQELPAELSWALNEFVIDRSGPAGLITIDVKVDGVPLNRYWADGLIFSTPTGSTAYSLSAGGPIVSPACEVIILTPIAPHTLTLRPIVLPASVTLETHVYTGGQPYVLAADGRSQLIAQEGQRITIRRAAHTVNLVKLPEQHYFQTLRTKLMWGAR